MLLIQLLIYKLLNCDRVEDPSTVQQKLLNHYSLQEDFAVQDRFETTQAVLRYNISHTFKYLHLVRDFVINLIIYI